MPFLPTLEEARKRGQYDGFALARLFALCEQVDAEEAIVKSIRVSQQTPPADTGVEPQSFHPDDVRQAMGRCPEYE